MVFNLEKLMPKPRTELPDEKRLHYAHYYAGVMTKLGYRMDEYNEDSYRKLADYFARWYAGIRKIASMPEKGLFIFGEKGTGKTTAMSIFSGLFNIDIIPVEDLTVAFTVGREASFWRVANEYKYCHLIVDDVCNESSVKSYGNDIPMTEFLKQREELWRWNKLFTFYTSNAKDRSEITRLYGDTITSRILGSCEFIRFSGPDRRISNNNNQRGQL